LVLVLFISSVLSPVLFPSLDLTALFYQVSHPFLHLHLQFRVRNGFPLSKEVVVSSLAQTQQLDVILETNMPSQ
jgi:hypothetical protein